jgi:tetratricopeptide (TPR) repeat protein
VSRQFFLPVLALMLGAGANDALAAGLVESAIVEKTDGIVALQLYFGCPVQYLTHVSNGNGNRVRVELIPGDQCQAYLTGEPVRDTLRPGGRGLAKLDYVEYVVMSPGVVSVVLAFDLPVSVQVPVQRDPRALRLEIDVSLSAADGNPTVSSRVPDPPGTSNPAAAKPPARTYVPASRDASPAPPAHTDFAVNLQSSRQPITVASLDPALLHDGEILYLNQLAGSGLTWYRLRLGFFATEAAAELAAAAWRPHYPNLWIVKVPAGEQASGREFAVVPGTTDARAIPQTLTRLPMTRLPSESLTTEQRAASMEDGRQALLSKDYGKAIQAYTRVASETGTAESILALEWLGLARERNGQTAQAMAEYQRYLDLYPEGDGAGRVRQRLAGLETARDAPRVARAAAGTDDRWQVYGGAMQYYRYDAGTFGGVSRTLQSAVLSDMDAVVERRGERWNMKARSTAGNYYDMRSDQSGSGTDTRLYNLYAELSDKELDITGRLGRQTLRNAGTPGRFDGVHLSWDWRPTVRFNLMTGFPAWHSETSVNTDQVFYGGSIDFSQVADLVDVSVFYNTQEIDGIQDREAVGGEVRYFDERWSLLTALDYDLGYGELNTFYALGNWRLGDEVTINASADFRKSPFLTTEDALIGQPVESIDQLLGLYTEEEIRQLAEDRSGTAQTYSLGFSRPLGDRFQVNADVSRSQFDSTPSSGGVIGYPDLGSEYYYSMYVLGYSLLKEGDVATLGVRYGDGSSATTTMLMLDNRYPIADRWRLNPRLRLYYREYDTDSSQQWTAAPSMRLFYQFSRRYRLELEGGGEWSTRKLATGNEDTSAYFFYMGYQADF